MDPYKQYIDQNIINLQAKIQKPNIAFIIPADWFATLSTDKQLHKREKKLLFKIIII